MHFQPPYVNENNSSRAPNSPWAFAIVLAFVISVCSEDRLSQPGTCLNKQ